MEEKPVDLQLGTTPNTQGEQDETDLPNEHQLVHRLAEARRWVTDRMKIVKQKQTETFDANRTELKFQPGNLLLINKPIRKVGRTEKLLHRWLGPYRVIRSTTPVNYEVVLVSVKKKPYIVHVQRMKAFCSPMEIDFPETPRPSRRMKQIKQIHEKSTTKCQDEKKRIINKRTKHHRKHRDWQGRAST